MIIIFNGFKYKIYLENVLIQSLCMVISLICCCHGMSMQVIFWFPGKGKNGKESTKEIKKHMVDLFITIEHLNFNMTISTSVARVRDLSLYLNFCRKICRQSRQSFNYSTSEVSCAENNRSFKHLAIKKTYENDMKTVFLIHTMKVIF